MYARGPIVPLDVDIESWDRHAGLEAHWWSWVHSLVSCCFPSGHLRNGEYDWKEGRLFRSKDTW